MFTQRSVIVRCQRPAEGRIHTEHWKVFARDQLHLGRFLLWLAIDAQVDVHNPAHRCHSPGKVCRVAQSLEFYIGETACRSGSGFQADTVQFLGLFDGEGFEHHAIEDRKDGAVRSDAQSERENCDGCEAGVASQSAYCVAQILPPRLHKRFPAGSANDFPCGFETPHFQTHCSNCIVVAHTLLHLFMGRHLQIAA